MEIHSLTKTILRIDCLCPKGEPDNVEEVERREGDNDNLSDSEGKPHESYHGDSQQNQDDTDKSLRAKGELDDDDEDEWRDGNGNEYSDSEGKPR